MFNKERTITTAQKRNVEVYNAKIDALCFLVVFTSHRLDIPVEAIQLKLYLYFEDWQQGQNQYIHTEPYRIGTNENFGQGEQKLHTGFMKNVVPLPAQLHLRPPSCPHYSLRGLS